MLKACSKCGRVHDYNFQCQPPRQRTKKPSKIDAFRSGKPWQKKREQIKQRDRHLCQICIRNLYNTLGRLYNFIKLQVHHIIPLAEDFERRLDDSNLITLCAYHHSMAEDGDIPREELLAIVAEVSPPGHE